MLTKMVLLHFKNKSLTLGKNEVTEHTFASSEKFFFWKRKEIILRINFSSFIRSPPWHIVPPLSKIWKATLRKCFPSFWFATQEVGNSSQWSRDNLIDWLFLLLEFPFYLKFVLQLFSCKSGKFPFRFNRTII